MMNSKHRSRKYVGIVVCLFIIISTVSQSVHITNSQVYFPYFLGIGTIIPPFENNQLSITEASISVIAEVQYEKDYTAPITIDCNFSIYNPGPLLNTTIFFPYSDDLMSYTPADLTIWFNNTEVVPKGTHSETYQQLRNLFDNYYYWFYLMDGLVFPTNTTTQMRIKIETSLFIQLSRYSPQFYISIDVQASNLWMGNINQTIEFICKGEQPFEFSNYSITTPQRKCDVIDFDLGSSYIWTWETAPIIEETVYVTYRVPRDKPFTFLVVNKILVAMITIVVSALVAHKTKLLRKKKGGS